MNLSYMLALCTSAHRDQYDKGGQPYALHPLAVMLNTDELRCIALGHDLLEDTHVTKRLLT